MHVLYTGRLLADTTATENLWLVASIKRLMAATAHNSKLAHPRRRSIERQSCVGRHESLEPNLVWLTSVNCASDESPPAVCYQHLAVDELRLLAREKDHYICCLGC